MNVAEILKAIKKAVSPTDWEDILKDAADGDSDGDADDSADGGSDDGDADDKDEGESEDDFWQGKLEEVQAMSIDAP